MIENRIYGETPADKRRFRVYFRDHHWREFHRVALAMDEQQAIWKAMVDDRNAGGSNDITFTHVKEIIL